MTVSVLVPWKSADPQRRRIWAYLKMLYTEVEIDLEEHLEIVEGTYEGEGPWIKANAWADALARSTGDVVVFMDADCWIPRLVEAIRLLPDANWVQADNMILRFTEGATATILNGRSIMEAAAQTSPFEDTPRFANAGVGTILRRGDAEAIPLDPRFVGWGWEDNAWADALTTLLGEPTRLPDSVLFHLWHEPQPDKDRTPRGSNPNWQLRRRYARAAHHPMQMKALIDEFASEAEEPGGD